jgi:hypothetical protein
MQQTKDSLLKGLGDEDLQCRYRQGRIRKNWGEGQRSTVKGIGMVELEGTGARGKDLL